MEYKSYKIYGKVIVAQSACYDWGVLDIEGNEIVPFGKYSWIDGFDQGLARVRSGRVAIRKGLMGTEKKIEAIEGKDNNIKGDKVKNPRQDAKWGIINEEGEEVIAVEYDEIWNFLGKNRFSTKVVKNGESHQVFFHDLNPSLPLKEYRSSSRSYDDDSSYDDDIDYEEETWYALTDGQYGDYPGSGVDYDFLGF